MLLQMSKEENKTEIRLRQDCHYMLLQMSKEESKIEIRLR